MGKQNNTLIVWDDKKDKLKEKFSCLTERDLFFDQGNIEIMLEKLQLKLHITRHELYKIISKL
jgi:hypothetical protein